MKTLVVTLPIALVLATPAEATLMFSADINGIVISCSDNQGPSASCPGGDTNPAIGQLAIGDTTVAGVQFIGSSQTQVIGPTNSLNTSSFQFINGNSTAVSLQLAVGGTDYLGPVTSFSASGSGTFQSAIGSTVDMSYFADPANGQGGNTPTSLPGISLVTPDMFTATLPTDSFSFNHTGPFDAAGAYSMSLGTTIELAAGGSVVGRNQAIVTSPTSAVPEPASLLILGSALMGLRLFARRRT